MTAGAGATSSSYQPPCANSKWKKCTAGPTPQPFDIIFLGGAGWNCLGPSVLRFVFLDVIYSSKALPRLLSDTSSSATSPPPPLLRIFSSGSSSALPFFCRLLLLIANAAQPTTPIVDNSQVMRSGGVCYCSAAENARAAAEHACTYYSSFGLLSQWFAVRLS